MVNIAPLNQVAEEGVQIEVGGDVQIEVGGDVQIGGVGDNYSKYLLII